MLLIFLLLKNDKDSPSSHDDSLFLWMFLYTISIFFFQSTSRRKITHVGTAESRLRSLIHKDENTHLWSARVNCEERERKREKNDVKTWDATNRMAGLQRHTHTKSTHITQGSFPLTTQNMSDMHTNQTETGKKMGIILVCTFSNYNIEAHFEGICLLITVLQIWKMELQPTYRRLSLA